MQSGAIEAQALVSLAYALGFCDMPVILCVQGESFDLKEAKSDSAAAASVLVTLVSCKSTNAPSLNATRDISTLIVSGAATMCRESDSHSDAVEMSRFHSVDGIVTGGLAELMCEFDRPTPPGSVLIRSMQQVP